MEIIKKKNNVFVRLWNYFSLYEKIWLFTLCSAGILLGIFCPEDPNEQTWLRGVQIIALIGGCSCELLVSKQSKWCFIVSFFFYDITQTIVYISAGLYISALFELIFWMPILWVSFFSWRKLFDLDDKNLTPVKKVNYKRDLLIFIIVLAVSFITGAVFTTIGALAEGMPDHWYLDALANAFSVCNGLFLLLRYREQWLPWYGVCVVEAILWILSGNYIMLVLSLGYLTNTTYGLIKWGQYIKTHPTTSEISSKQIEEQTTNAEAVDSKALEQTTIAEKVDIQIQEMSNTKKKTIIFKQKLQKQKKIEKNKKTNSKIHRKRKTSKQKKSKKGNLPKSA